MSFSNEVKEHILSLNFKNKCCKKAFFYGAMMGADISDGQIRVSITDPKTVDLITYIASTVFKLKEIDMSEIRHGFYSATRLSFSLPTVISLLQEIDGNSADGEALKGIMTCQSCISRFFGGLFCACGTVSDPSKGYCLEIGLPNRERAECIMSLFHMSTDLTPGMRKRGNGYGLFFRNGDGVSGFLTLCQIGPVVFDLVNQQLENQLIGDQYRATNCDTGNIKRAINASLPQVSAIQKLIESGKFEMLPEQLKISATLRIQNPELPLKHLAALHNPPITKSGLCHRMEKIIKLSEED